MRYILILTFLLNSLFATQEKYSIIIKKPFNEALLDVTQDYDRKVSVIGYSNSYEISKNNSGEAYSDAFEYLNSLSNKYGPHIDLIKVDKNKKIILNKVINSSEFSKAVSIIKTSSNGYFVGGYNLDGSLIIIKIDSNGRKIFSKTFGTKNRDKMNNLISLQDGGVLSVGYSRTSRSASDNIFESGLGLNDIYLTRFSKNGTKLWSKKYGTKNDDEGIDAVEANDGSIMVVSTTETSEKKDVTFMRITQNGDKLWIKHYQSDEQITPHKIIKLKDNNFLLSLSKKDNLQNDQIKLIKFTIHKKILLDKDIYTTYSSVLKDIKEYTNGNIIGVGYVQDSYNTDALAILVNQDLKLLNQNHFGDDSYDLFNAVTILNNSQAVAVGIHTDENVQESNMWIVKLNHDLNIFKLPINKQKIKTGIYKHLLQIFKKELASKKLTIKKDLTIEFEDKNLYFKEAKYRLTKQQKDFLAKFSNKLIPFLEKNKQNIKTIEINGHTSSEWGKQNFTNDYLKNQKLSMNRAYSTLAFIFKHQDKKTKVWLSKIFKGSGLSFSKKVMVNNSEDKKRSRRVSFKIILNDTKKGR